MSAFVVGLLTGVLSGCGIGGGSLLLLWLTLVQDMPQFTAGGINLLYFLACAPAALVSHLKNHLIDRGAVKFCVPFGAMTSLLASFAAAGTPPCSGGCSACCCSISAQKNCLQNGKIREPTRSLPRLTG